VETRERDLAMADRTAALVRAAFAQGDRFPGLPTADGSAETAAEVLAELARGVRLWTSFDEDGKPLGCIRAIPDGEGAWAVRRLAVHPRSRGRSVGRLLIRALEDQARAEGLERVTLDAVVERGNPPFYCRLGYRTIAHIPGPDKPLSEVSMVKELAGSDESLSYPWGGEPVPLWDGSVRAWFSGPSGTVALAASLGTDPATALSPLTELAGAYVGPARFLGADGLPEIGGAMVFDRPADDVSAFLMPRAADPDALALWRITD
jgi:GNAT superfamily N-acetyltransferase